MYSEVWHPREGFPTFVTFKRFLSWMNSMMYSEIRHLREEFATFVNTYRLSLLCNLWCLLRAEFWQKVFPTFVIFVGLLPEWILWCIVRYDICEELPICNIHRASLLYVSSGVYKGQNSLVEGLPTFITFVGLHSWVSSVMYGEAIQLGE